MYGETKYVECFLFVSFSVSTVLVSIELTENTLHLQCSPSTIGFDRTRQSFFPKTRFTNGICSKDLDRSSYRFWFDLRIARSWYNSPDSEVDTIERCESPDGGSHFRSPFQKGAKLQIALAQVVNWQSSLKKGIELCQNFYKSLKIISNFPSVTNARLTWNYSQIGQWNV